MLSASMSVERSRRAWPADLEAMQEAMQGAELDATPATPQHVPTVLPTLAEAATWAVAAVGCAWLALGVCVLLQLPVVGCNLGLRLPRTAPQLADVLCMSLHIVITRPALAMHNAAALWSRFLAPAVAAVMVVDTAYRGVSTARLQHSMYSECGG